MQKSAMKQDPTQLKDWDAMSNFEEDHSDNKKTNEWVCYDENIFKSLNPVDVLFDKKHLVENVILFDGDVFEPDYEAINIKIRNACNIRLFQKHTDKKYKEVTHFRYRD